MIPILAFVLPFLIFISFPSHMWNFDGVACATALELGNSAFFFHSNHLLYGFLGFLFWKPLSPVLPRALPALQLFTSLLSAAGLTGLYYALQNHLLDQRQALLTTLGIGVTAVVWVWSVEAQVYALGFLALAWATYFVFQQESQRKWVWVGALNAGAILGHIVHVMWVLPALYWLWRENPPNRDRKLKQYLLALGAGTVIPYAVVITYIIFPYKLSMQWLTRWLMGSAALNPNSAFQWHTAGWTGPLEWAKTTLRIFWGSFWPYQTDVPLWGWIVTGGSMAVLLIMLGASWKQRKDARWVFCVLWLAVYGVFFWTWEPTTECYRMTDLIPFAILLALGMKSIKRQRVQWTLLSLWFVTLLPLNLRTRIQPMEDIQRNPAYQEMLALSKRTPADSVYLTIGGLRRMYLLYFFGRSAWDLHAFARNRERLADEIARHFSRGPVFVQAAALQSDLTRPWISRYKPRPLGDPLPWYQLR